MLDVREAGQGVTFLKPTVMPVFSFQPPNVGSPDDDGTESEEEVAMIAGLVSMFHKQLPVKAVTWELVKTVIDGD